MAELLRIGDDLMRAYNTRGVAGVLNSRRGRVVVRRRLLTLAQGAELQQTLEAAQMTNGQLADWIEARCGRRPDATMLWSYRRRVPNHSQEGRRAQGVQP
ncbi:hypothetical protein [Deinococcus koreensis]|uniref:Uncharacterized protein n=1 Tax=Deinococcus koreensis TaxID=2054903 RepID=A0A2K3V1U2_9DEIO|nr:hypothetical protein [Deinococcus koreensis]PNY82749.1 hypothetical protein CVO96_16555 [Deinococcus koreensis]